MQDNIYRHTDSDVTIIESKIEIEFFLKIELNRNRLFGWYFFDFDSRLYQRRQGTAASSKHDSWAVACWIRRLNCGRGGCAVPSPRPPPTRPLQGVV